MRLKNKAIGELIYQTFCKHYTNDLQIKTNYQKYQIEILRFNNTRNLNCRKWALKALGLNSLTRIPQDKFCNMLINNEITELKKTQTPKEKNLVAYRGKNSNEYKHYAIIHKITLDNIIVLSVWGTGGFYAKHPISHIYNVWGNIADFYQKQTQ